MNISNKLPRGFLHVQHLKLTIPTNRMNEAIHFYNNILGLPLAEDQEKTYQIGNLKLRLTADEEVVNRAYISLEVKDILLAKLFLAGQNIEYTEYNTENDQRAIEFNDPFGNKFEWIEKIKTDYKLK